MNKEIKKERVEYASFTQMMKAKESHELTEIEGVKNYKLKPVYAPVLDINYLDKFNPKATCISLQGNETFELKDNKKFVEQVISIIERIREYYKINTHNENIFEYSLFDHFNGIQINYNYNLENLILNTYTISKNSEGEYYLILWFTPEYYNFKHRKHLHWYGETRSDDWY